MTSNKFSHTNSDQFADISLLRRLRGRSDDLLVRIKEDLGSFLHQKDGFTFLRTPDSSPISGDVNVTTTCSCVMALALTGQFDAFYRERGNVAAGEILRQLIKAPWMSSGLILNNPFTSILVLRTYGFLKQLRLLRDALPPLEKRWELNFQVRNPARVARKIMRQGTPATRFIYRSLTDSTRKLLETPTESTDKLSKALTSDLRRIMQSGWIHDEERFGKSDGLDNVLREINAYKVIEFNHDLIGKLFSQDVSSLKMRSFKAIATEIAKNPKANFAINDYPASAAVAYWFVDGVTRAEFVLENGDWEKICKWSREEFDRQHSLVQAKQHSLMDPIAMAMAACLCARLRETATNGKLGMNKKQIELLPSEIELEHSIRTLFALQAESGIWQKYFPMFHYLDQGAGSNFCFAFELLEAILNEFGRGEGRLLDDAAVLSGLSSALDWCERNRLKDSNADKSYTGWNSGGYITTLRKNQPESWATAVVYMFLYELSMVLSKHIQRRVLKKYGAVPSAGEENTEELDGMMDIELDLQGQKSTLKRVLMDELIQKHSGKSESSLRRGERMVPTSALLFGPPGTSKTSVTKAVAQALNWPLLMITPSEFVKGTFAQVYDKAEEIFEDMLDLSGVVVFFDEMDALMQSRDKSALDTATQFLTTAMLPKLTKLHDKGQVIFFMATNFQERFDQAIKRAGRFDLLLCMGPPPLSEKLAKLDRFFGKEPEKALSLAEKKKAISAIQTYVKKNPSLQAPLDLLTYGEFRALLKRFGSNTNVGSMLQRVGKQRFEDEVIQIGHYMMLRVEDLPWEYKEALSRSWGDEDDECQKRALRKEIGRYLRDRKESKLQ